MAKRAYSDKLLADILDVYFTIRADHEIPEYLIISAQQRGERAPFESAVILLADIDKAIDALSPSPGRWLRVCKDICFDDFWTDMTRQSLSKLIYSFSHYQQAIMRYHWLNQQEERETAAYARRLMRRFLNDGIKPSYHQRRGGFARADKLSPARRKSIARYAASRRWKTGEQA